jgi:hypothetical protein
MLVGKDGQGEDDCFFGAEKDRGAGEHERVIRDFLGWFGGPVKRQRRAARTARSAIEADAPSAPFTGCRGQGKWQPALAQDLLRFTSEEDECLSVWSVVIQTWVEGIAS